MIVLVIAALSMCDSRTKTVTTGPAGTTTTTTTTTVGATTFISRVISWLRIAELVLRVFEHEEKVVVQPKDPQGSPIGQPVVFYPVEFARRHGIENEMMAVSLDENITNIFRQCTQEALDTGMSNDRLLREHRVNCLDQGGFNANDKTYIQIKQPTFWI